MKLPTGQPICGCFAPLVEEGDETGHWTRCVDCQRRFGFQAITANPFFAGPVVDQRARRWPAMTAVLILAAVVVLFFWFGATTLG